MTSIVPVVLSGGSGTRLWPASRAHQPKQLLPLVGERSLIGDTLARVAGLDGAAPAVVVTNASHAVGIERALAEQGLDDVTLVIEPVGRNTAPAIAAAAHLVDGRNGDALMLVLPSDHAIADAASFRAAVHHGGQLAADGRLVTFGIRAASPETGFGYIRAGDPVDERAFTVAEFVEKPDLPTAERYVASGEYTWNSGMFLFSARTLLAELERHRPDIADAVAHTWEATEERPGRRLLDADRFGQCPAESIDYAVMEQTDSAVVIPIDPGWSDVGTWTALWDITDKDPDGNVLSGDVLTHDTTHSLVHSHDRLVAVAGLEGVVVVDTADAVLVTSLAASQQVKDVVDDLKALGRDEVRRSDWEARSWGTVTASSHLPGLNSWLVTVDVGATTDERTHDATTFVRALAGEGSVRVGGSEHRLDPGAAVAIDPSTAWAIRNTGESELSVSIVRVDTVVTDVDSAY